MNKKTGNQKQQQVNIIAARYLNCLLKAKRREAIDCILKEVDNGLPIESVYLHIIQPVMYEVGRLWQAHEIDIAVEHYCSASTQLLMAQLFPYVLAGKNNGLAMVGCCLGSELHEMGLRIVCDFFELEGWDTYFTGAVTPGHSLINTVKDLKPDLICLSSTMYFGVPETRDVIRDIRRIPELDDVKIMVGGLAYLMNPDLYKVFGADGTAKDARQAVDMANKLLAE